MFKKALFSCTAAFALIGCGGGSSSSSTSSIISVERGAVLNSTVKDSSGKVATWQEGTNKYQFEGSITYPITATGGFIDLNNDGIKNNDDFDLDIELKSNKGDNITLLSTIISSDSTQTMDEKLSLLSEKFGISKDDLLKLPSTKKEIALLSNLIYKEFKLNPDLTTQNIVELIENEKIDILKEYQKVDLQKYSNLSNQEFFKQHENNTIQEIQKATQGLSKLAQYNGLDITSTEVINQGSAYISPQCYTKTEDEYGTVSNPCFSCHINSDEPNYIDDWDLQESYAFGINSKINPFINSFKDRTSLVEQISDEQIMEYVNQDNYKDSDGNIKLALKLKYDLPDEWDMAYNGQKDGVWQGFVPDCYFNFDEDGYDIDNNGNLTGWRAFGYSPFLGTFWPTNGSTDDVMIRLPNSMMKDSDGNFSKEVYEINLAIVESMIKKEDIALAYEVDESNYEVDLNHNGAIDKTSTIVYKWNTPDAISNYPLVIYKNYYVGLAKSKLETNELHISPGLYPDGTEFIHSVRYIGINDDESGIKMANRMKELRYAKKTTWNNYAQLNNAALAEIKEKDDFPDRLRTITGNIEDGLSTGLGWIYQGFIEDINGELRPQSYEETLSCIGCHSGIGSITDSTFAFPRKDNTYNNGWYHWSQKDLTGLKDRILPNGEGEYAFYLAQNKAGDEFRANEEVKNKFFNENGELIQSEVDKIADDITYLIFPSVQRAINLNKAYKVIVDEQSFIYGKDAHIKPLSDTVYDEVEIDKSTGISAIKF